MQVILLQRVAKLGQMGEVVNVKDGYARNYLLPQGKALRANESNIKSFEAKKAQLELQNLETKKEAEVVGAKLDGQSFVVIRSASDAGALYGSVSPRDAADAATEAGFTLDRKQIVTPYAHTAGGTTPVTYVSAASTNATLVKNSAGQIYTVICTNVNASPRYLKLFDKSTSPTVGTDVPVQNYMIPANSNGFVIALPMPLQFTSGIGFAITTGIALTNAAAVAANEISVNIGYK